MTICEACLCVTKFYEVWPFWFTGSSGTSPLAGSETPIDMTIRQSFSRPQRRRGRVTTCRTHNASDGVACQQDKSQSNTQVIEQEMEPVVSEAVSRLCFYNASRYGDGNSEQNKQKAVDSVGYSMSPPFINIAHQPAPVVASSDSISYWPPLHPIDISNSFWQLTPSTRLSVNRTEFRNIRSPLQHIPAPPPSPFSPWPMLPRPFPSSASTMTMFPPPVVGIPWSAIRPMSFPAPSMWNSDGTDDYINRVGTSSNTGRCCNSDVSEIGNRIGNISPTSAILRRPWDNTTIIDEQYDLHLLHHRSLSNSLEIDGP